MYNIQLIFHVRLVVLLGEKEHIPLATRHIPGTHAAKDILGLDPRRL